MKNIRKILPIIIRLIVIVVSAVCFYGFRFLLLAIGLVLFFVDLLRTHSPRKYKLTLVALDCSVIAVVSALVFSNALDIAAENMRFKVLENQYEATVEETLPTLQSSQDTSWSSYKFESLLPLSIHNELVYRKYGDNIAIYFSTFHSFSTDSGFIYFSDETARDFFENPSKYDSSLDEDLSYVYIDEYDSNWAFIQLY